MTLVAAVSGGDDVHRVGDTFFPFFIFFSFFSLSLCAILLGNKSFDLF